MCILVTHVINIKKQETMEMDSPRETTKMEHLIMSYEEAGGELASITKRYRSVLSRLENVELDSERPEPSEAMAKQVSEPSQLDILNGLGNQIHNLNRVNMEILSQLEKLI